MRVLELLIFFATEVTIKKSLQFSHGDCISPRIENLGSGWSIYRNLVNVDVYSCQITKTTRKFNCNDNGTFERNYFRYYDVTRRCADITTTNHLVKTDNRSDCSDDRTDFWVEIEKLTRKEVKTYGSKVNFENDKLFVHSGFSCNYSYGFCYDKYEAYVWNVHPPSPFSCYNLASFNVSYTNILKFSLDREYLIFENDERATAIELIEERNLCGGKMWIGTRGYIATNDSYFTGPNAIRRSYPDHLLELPKKDVYESLVENCKKSQVISEKLLYFYALVALLVYAFLNLLVCIYNHFVNFMALRRIGGGFCGGLFQSWINREFINMSKVEETRLEMDRELVVSRNTDRPSYYMYQARSDK